MKWKNSPNVLEFSGILTKVKVPNYLTFYIYKFLLLLINGHLLELIRNMYYDHNISIKQARLGLEKTINTFTYCIYLGATLALRLEWLKSSLGSNV